MRQSYRIIPIYTSDVSGVCSALYELGGMVVMHDPSGCNSTYNTHDEIRWYDQDSLIFISGLTEIDAVMGNDEKFLSDIKEAAREFHPKFIALVSSPIPFMNGTDFPALAKVLELKQEYHPLQCRQMECMIMYMEQESHSKKLQRFVTEKEARGNYGKTDSKPAWSNTTRFWSIPRVEELKNNLENVDGRSFQPGRWETVGRSCKAGNAEINLVVSAVGLRAAKALKEKFGTPYVIGTPYKEYAERISEALEKKIPMPALEDRKEWEKNTAIEDWKSQIVTLIGEPVTTTSLAALIEKEYHYKTKVLCPLEETDGLIGSQDLKYAVKKRWKRH